MAGSYENQGERGQMAHIGPISLGALLLPWGGGKQALGQAQIVAVSFPRPGTLQIDFHGGGEWAALTLSRDAGHFNCKDGRIFLHTPAEWDAGMTHLGPYAGGESVTLRLELVDRYLYVTKQDAGFMWLPIPMRSTWSSWYRFERVAVTPGA